MYRLRMATTRSRIAPIAICLAFGLAACGDDNSSPTTDSATAPIDDGDRSGYDLPTVADTTVPETSATDAPYASVDDSSDGAFVQLADSALGQILVDFDGFTLYLFASDPPDSVTCTGGCASTWPPVFAPADLEVGEGLDDDLFTVVDGENGPQLSFNGHPLYYYEGDTQAGDTNGQGVGGVWFVLDAAGNPIT